MSKPFQILFFLSLLTLAISCKEEKTKKDITEVVVSTTSIIDKNIEVKVDSGVVTLNGEVADEATKTAALNAVKHIEGVKKVESYLTVKEPTKVAPMSKTDILLHTTIDSAFTAKGIQGVEITVRNGEVTLTGSILRARETEIIKIAGEAHPSRLTNALTITDKEK